MASSFILVALFSHLLTAEPSFAPTPADMAAARSAAAAERAADAAQKAAEAAQTAATAAKTLAEKAVVAAEAKAETPKEKFSGPVWTGTAALGMISLTGNSRSIAVNGTGSVERKSESWIFGMKAALAYGEAKAPGNSEWAVNALNASLQARGAYRFTERYSGYLLAGIDTDHLNSIEERPYGEAGVGILWLDEMQGDLSKLRLNTDIAFRYGRELRFQYYPTPENLPNVTIAAPRVGAAFRYALNKDVIFTEDAELLTDVSGDARWLITSMTKIAARLVNPLAISVAMQVKYDSLPATGKVNTDTALIFGVEAGF